MVCAHFCRTCQEFNGSDIMKLKPYAKYKDSGIQWIGEIPEEWEANKIKHLTENLDGKRIPISAEEREDGKIPYYGATGVLDYIKDFIFNEELLLVGEDGAPFFEPFKDVAYIINRKAWVNNHAHVLRVIGNNSIKWLCHYLNVYDYGTVIKGSTRDKLNQDQLSNMFVTKPLIEQQTTIASFLDKKTAKIDVLIEKDKKLIELLKEKRTSLINHVVTKGLPVRGMQTGLDPNEKMKDSGIEWIGEIPEGWEVRKIMNTSYVKGRIGWHGLTSEEYSDEGAYLVTGTDFKDGVIEWDDCRHVGWDRYKEDPYIHLKEDDLLITKDGTIGKVGLIKILPNKATLNSGIFLVRPLNKKYIPKFMYWMLNSAVFERFFDYIKTGATISHLYQETFERFFFPIPPKQDQTAIVNFLDKATSKIDKTIQKIEKKIKLLEEYKKSLIHHIITGKIDVRGVEI